MTWSIKVKSKAVTDVYELHIKLIPLPYADWDKLVSLFDRIIQIANPILEKFGYRALKCSIDKANNELIIYIQKLGSPIPVLAIVAVLAAIAGILLGCRFLLEGWYLVKHGEAEVIEEQTKHEVVETANELLKQRRITPEQHQKLIELAGLKEEKPPEVEIPEEKFPEEVIPEAKPSPILQTLANLLPIALLALVVFMIYKMVSWLRR